MDASLIKQVAKLMAKSPTIQDMAVRSVQGWEEFLSFFTEEQVQDFKTILEEEEKMMLDMHHEHDRKEKQIESKFQLAAEQIIFKAQQS